MDGRRAPLRLAVLDDDPAIRRVVQIVCARDPIVECVLAEPGPATAIPELAAAAPDVVLLDVELGATDGASLVPAISQRCPDAMVMLFSSLGADDGVRLASRSGAFGFYEKWVLGTSLPATLLADHDRFLATRCEPEPAPR